MKAQTLFEQYVELVGSRREVSRRLGVTESQIGHILHGRRGISPALALRIEKDTNGLIRKETLIWPEHAA